MVASRRDGAGNGVRTHNNEGQDGLPKVKFFPQGKGKQEKRTVDYCFEAQEMNPEWRRRTCVQVLPEQQGLCPEGLWVSTKAVGAVAGRAGNGQPPQRTCHGVAQVLFSRCLPGSRPLREGQSAGP